MIKCLALDRNLKGCRCNAINDTRFCKKHDYMVDYTEEMLSNLQVCSGCKNHITYPMVILVVIAGIEEKIIDK